MGLYFLLIFMSYEIFIEIYKIVVEQIKLVIENAEIMKLLILLDDIGIVRLNLNVYNHSV